MFTAEQLNAATREGHYNTLVWRRASGETQARDITLTNTLSRLLRHANTLYPRSYLTFKAPNPDRPRRLFLHITRIGSSPAESLYEHKCEIYAADRLIEIPAWGRMRPAEALRRISRLAPTNTIGMSPPDEGAGQRDFLVTSEPTGVWAWAHPTSREQRERALEDAKINLETMQSEVGVAMESVRQAEEALRAPRAFGRSAEAWLRVLKEVCGAVADVQTNNGSLHVWFHPVVCRFNFRDQPDLQDLVIGPSSLEFRPDGRFNQIIGSVHPHGRCRGSLAPMLASNQQARNVEGVVSAFAVWLQCYGAEGVEHTNTLVLENSLQQMRRNRWSTLWDGEQVRQLGNHVFTPLPPTLFPTLSFTAPVWIQGQRGNAALSQGSPAIRFQYIPDGSMAEYAQGIFSPWAPAFSIYDCCRRCGVNFHDHLRYRSDYDHEWR